MMRFIKFITVMALMAFLMVPVTGRDRVKPKSMKELTNPKSISYVPFPYPKKRKEVIADLLHYAREFCDETKINYNGPIPREDIILSSLLKPQSDYRIAEIEKIRNPLFNHDKDYTWLIIVRDLKGNIAVRISLKASGLFSRAVTMENSFFEHSSHEVRKRMKRKWKLSTKKNVMAVLEEYPGIYKRSSEIIRMEKVAFRSKLGSLLFPLWEIEMKDGTIYYYSKNSEVLFGVDKRYPWILDGDANIKRAGKTLESLPHRDFLRDTVNDQLIVLKRIEKKSISLK